MKIFLKSGLLCALILASHFTIKAQFGTICGDPAVRQCAGQYDDFKPQDLIFNTGRAQLGTGTRHESNEFYAVILESVKAEKKGGAGCQFVSETKRQAAQKLFPKNKVFASREFCRGTIVRYEGADENYNFAAIYAGENETQAARILARARKKYPSANIRKMKVVLDFGDE